MVAERELRQPFALEDYLATSVQPAAIVAAKATAALAAYRPDPTTGKQEPGTILSFGLANLDEFIMMLKGCYYVVAARPRTGKSAFALQVADSVMRQLAGTNRTVVIFSAEMDSASLALREACALEGLSYWNMVRGKLAQGEYDRIQRRVKDNGEGRFFLDESSAPTVEHMVAQLDSLQKSGIGIGLVVFDYLQLGGEMDRDETRRINKISRGLKGIAKRFGCPVLALAQLNREIERRKEGQPQLADLAYGGEQDPDGIILLNRPWLLDQAKPRELVEAWVVKHRHGPGGFCFLHFDEQTMRFRQAALRRVELNEGENGASERKVREPVGGPGRPATGKGSKVRPPTEVASGLHQYPLQDDD